MVPTFTTESIDEGGAHLDPDSIATATPRTFTVASPPDRLAGFGVSLGHNQQTRPCTAHRPLSVRFEPALDLRGVKQWFLAYTFSSLLAGPGPSDSADPVPYVVAAAPTLARVPTLGLPPASLAGRDRPAAESSHLHSIPQRLVAHRRLPIRRG
jgi:hypothetical protein